MTMFLRLLPVVEIRGCAVEPLVNFVARTKWSRSVATNFPTSSSDSPN
ncbi:hypothetical protein AB0945_38565 [Streptomyces sp. NPDC005474]